MKKITLSLAVLAAMGTSLMAGGDMTPVVEEVVVEVIAPDYSGFYVGGGYSYQKSDIIDYSFGGIDVEVETDNILLVAGYDYNQYIGAELRYSFSVGDGEVSDMYETDKSSDYTTDNLAIYLKPQYLMDNGFGVYALLGYGKTTFENSTEKGDDSGFQWGLGAKYTVMENVSVFVDYTDLVNGGSLDGIEATPGVPADLDVDTYAWNFGVTYKF